MKKFLRCLALIAALSVGWGASAQTLDEYTFATGVDSTKWVVLNDYTDISGTGSGDGWASTVMNIGFAFPFGSESYTQYSVNSDGNLRLGATATGTGNYSTPFSSSSAGTNNPKINFFGCDGYLVSNHHFIHSQNFGDTLLVVEYCLGPYNSTYRNNQFHWQVHLFSDGRVEAVFASAANLNSNNSHYMGMCVDATDGWIISSSNVASFFSNGTTTSWSSTTWPTPYTYYTFVKPNNTCPRPASVTVSGITAYSATISFTPSGTETSWIGTISDGNITLTQTLSDTIITIPMLTPNTDYTVSVRALCGDGDTSSVRGAAFHTLCVPITLADLPYTEDFEAYGSGSSYPISYCWTKGTNSSTAYPYPYTSAAINGSRGLYFYGYKPSSATGTRIYSYAAMPELAPTVDISNLTLRFNAKRYSNTTVYYRSVLHVGVMTDPTDISTFDTLETFNLTSLPASTVVGVEMDLNSYTGTGRYIAFLVPDIDTNTSYSYNYVYLDDVELLTTPTCRRPIEVATANITSTSAVLSWTPGSTEQTTFVVAYGTTANIDSMTSVVVTGTSLTLSALSETTQYYAHVRSICDGNDTSEWSVCHTFTTHQVPVVLSTRNFFKEDFESGTGWLFANGTSNKWYIGNATNNGGEQSLYISNNNGVGNAYTTTSQQWAYAQKALTLPAGQYVVSFDWKANGESNYDYLRAFLVPIDVVLTGNVSPTGGSPSAFRSVTPTGWIALDGGGKLNLQSSWQSRTDTATVTTAGDYNLLFVWANDGSSGSQPPAAVDNVKIVYKPANATMVILANADPTMGYTIPEPDNYYYAAGDTMRATAMPYYGYEFEYWEIDAGLIRDSITINPVAQVVPSYLANMSFNATAHFSPMTFTVSVASNNTLLGTVTGSGSYTYLDTATLTATPNSGFRFLRWSDGSTDAVRSLVVTSDTSLTAIFDYMPVTVTLNVANPSMGTTNPAPGTYTFSVGDTMRATAIPNQYHRFVSWTLSAMGLSESVTMNPVSEVVPLFLAGMSFNITCNFEEYHLPAFDTLYDFENSAADSAWTLLNGTATNQWVIDSAISNGGSRSLYITNDGGTTNAYSTGSTSFTYATLGGWMEPGVYSISYDWRANGEGNYDYMRAFLAPIDYVFTPGQTPIGTTNSTAFMNYRPEGLTPLDGGTKKNGSSSFNTFNAEAIPIAVRGEYKIVFMWANDNSSGSQPPAAIDNISITQLHCPAPAALTATDITPNSAVLSWFALPDTATFTVEYGEDTTMATMMSVTGTSATIMGLTDNTDYFFRVAMLCDGNTVMSPWTMFHTSCLAINPAMLPYSENFDSYTTTTTAVTGIEPDCWTLAHYDVPITDNAQHPQVFYSTTNSYSDNYCLRMYYRCIYALPAIDTNINTLQMGFRVKQTSTNYRLIVGVMSDPTDESTFMPYDTIINNSTSEIQYHEVNFSNYTGNGQYIAFRNITTASYNYSYNYIDDVVVDLIPTCPTPTAVNAELLTSTSAMVSWTPTGSDQNLFAIAYGTGTDPELMTSVTSNTTSATLTGLASETNYNIYVRAICSANDQSPWSQPATIYTGYCQPAPTSIDASGITNVTFGTGSEVVNNSQRPTSAPYYGDYHSQMGGVQAGSIANVTITYSTGYTYGTIIWIDWNKNLTFDGDEVVYVGTAANSSPAILNASFLVPATIDTGVYRMRIAGADSYYDSYTGSIAAAANANPCPTSIYTIVHDYSLHVMPVASCQQPSSVTVSNVTYNAATLTWSDENSSATYTIYTDSTVAATGITGNTYTVAGLTPNTDYTFGVQANCSATETSDITYATAHTSVAPLLCGDDPASTISNADTNTGTTSYFPGYSLYDYSYTEVIITADRIAGLGEIKGMQFKPMNVTAGSSRFNNCEIYMMNTTATSLADNFIQDAANMQMVFSGDLSYTSNDWQTVTFDNPFQWNGTDNVVVAVRRNTGQYANSGYFASYTADSALARYAYRDGSIYNIGSVTGGYATNNVPVYHLIGCPTAANDCGTTCQITLQGVDSYGDGWNGGYITISQNNNVIDTFTVEDGSLASTTISVCSNYPVEFNWSEGMYGDEVSFLINDGGGNMAYYCFDGSELPTDSAFFTLDAPCPSCLMPTVAVDTVTTSSATISWNSLSDVTYTIYEDTNAIATGITANSYTFTGLTPNTNYTFGVQSNCSATDVSGIAFVTFRTTAEALSCNGGPVMSFANADNATTTTSYFPGYSLYNYSYSEVIVPVERLVGLGEIKGMEFKPTSIAEGSSYFNNCEIYMMNTTAASLSDGFIQDTDNLQLVYSGDLSYTDTTWQTVIFNNSFNWNGSDNLLIAVRRNHGTWASSGNFEAFAAGSQLARYVYRDGSAYTIGEITGGTATSTVPIYHLLGCAASCQITIEGEDSYGDGWNGGYIVVSQGGSPIDTFTVSGSSSSTTIAVTSGTPVLFSWSAGSYDDEVSFNIVNGGGATAYTCSDASNLTEGLFFTMNDPCPSCLAPSVTVDNLTNNTATITWNSDNSDATFTIYNDSVVVATGITANSYTFTGLTGHTQYNFGVQTNCSATDASSIAYVTLRTLADPIMCDSDTALTFANADSATSTTNYFPGYSYYNYSYTEVIIPAERVNGLGEIKGMEFKPTNVANGSSYFSNCEIYLMQTNVTSMAGGFIQDTTNMQLVFTGDLSYDNTNWQTITFDNTFTYNGIGNILVAVRRNHGNYASSGSFESYSATDTLARYVYRDGSAYTIGEISGGTATTNVPVYHLIGCEGTAPTGVTVTLAVNDTAMGNTMPAPGTYTFNVGDTMGAYAVANTGYHFDYWTLTLGTLTDTINTNPIAEVVPAYLAGAVFDITANFAPNMYLITTAANDSTMGTVTGAGSYAYGTTATLTATPATGYHFVQWNDADTHATRTITVTGNATYTATFAPNTYTLTVIANNALLGTVTGSGTYTYGSNATIAATPATNCHFVQWNDADTHATRTVTVTGDATYTATFAYNPVTITLAVNDTAMGTINPAPGIYTYHVGDTVTALAVPATGHSFQTWTIPGVTMPGLSLTDNPISVVIPAEAAGMSISATAQFAINSYTITAVPNDSTRGSVSGSGTYTYGTTLTLTATPAQHYYLLQWSDGDTHLTRNIIVTHDASFTAIFRALPQHVVTLSSTGGGTVSGNGLYYEDDMVTITATPDEYYAFVNWVDNDNNVVYTEPSVTFLMGTNDVMLTAVFEQVVFEATLDVTSNNIEWGHVLINGERSDHYQGHTGDTIVLQAVANDGYHFDHWDGVHTDADTALNEIVTIILTEPTTNIVCHFAENVGINDVAEDNTIIYTKHSNIVVSGAEQQTIRVFDVVGRLIAQRTNAAIEETIPMPATGVYLVKVGDRPARRVVVRK